MTRSLAAVAFLVLALTFVHGACAGQSAARLENARTSASAPAASENLAAWEFDSERDLQVWQPNAHLKDVTIAGGTLRARAVDWDPFLLCRQIQIDAGPWQYVVVRMKASRPGVAELFWSGQLEGRYGGLTEAKKLRFSVDKEDQWQEYVLFPFWHTERVIRQLRLDLYGGADFEIDWFRIEAWGEGVAQSGVCAWSLGGDVSRWRVHPAATDLFAPPTRIDVSDKKWVSIELASDREDLAAILWANHNPPGTHSEDDWLKLAAHWIDRYFSLPGYYRINGKPAVFIWDPRGIRNDLGGSQAVRKAFDKSQEMARTAGFGGITLIALGSDFSEGHIRALKEEGYFGVTTYHEWGPHIDGQVSRKVFRFEDVVRDSLAAWTQKNAAADGLVYYPLVDTGWDSRPWHGHKAMTIRGRTIGQFQELLRQAALFCREGKKRMLILGPVNEWGEGSYIEPCTEFGFEMLEAVRSVFATGSADDWPTNVAPLDVGLGPYDFPHRP